MIEDATAKNNQDTGIYLTGTGITVENTYIKNSEYGLAIGENNEITLDGDITVTNNKYGARAPSDAQGTVYVTGDFNLNRNVVGLLPLSDKFTIAVGGSYSGKSGKSGSGSLTACDNNGYDIDNDVGANFEGSDYTCGTTNGPVPECKPCHPGCDESSASETSQAMAQDTMATFMEAQPMLPSDGLP